MGVAYSQRYTGYIYLHYISICTIYLPALYIYLYYISTCTIHLSGLYIYLYNISTCITWTIYLLALYIYLDYITNHTIYLHVQVIYLHYLDYISTCNWLLTWTDTCWCSSRHHQVRRHSSPGCPRCRSHSMAHCPSSLSTPRMSEWGNEFICQHQHQSYHSGPHPISSLLQNFHWLIVWIGYESSNSKYKENGKNNWIKITIFNQYFY